MAGVDPDLVALVAAAATALAGTIVAALAYQGGRRNDSDAMRYLAVGVACIVVVPFPVLYGVAPLLKLSAAQAVLGVLLANIAGLLAILYSLDGT